MAETVHPANRSCTFMLEAMSGGNRPRAAPVPAAPVAEFHDTRLLHGCAPRPGRGSAMRGTHPGTRVHAHLPPKVAGWQGVATRPRGLA